jgi:hypothetical protein
MGITAEPMRRHREDSLTYTQTQTQTQTHTHTHTHTYLDIEPVLDHGDDGRADKEHREDGHVLVLVGVGRFLGLEGPFGVLVLFLRVCVCVCVCV